MSWHPRLPDVHSLMISDDGAEPGGNSGDPHRDGSPARGRIKLSSIMIGIIIVATIVLWATFLFWLAAKMIAWIATIR
jgi:hypothetical protein